MDIGLVLQTDPPWSRVTELAARRKACPARFLVLPVRLRMTLPPVISFLGARPSQEQKCLTVGQRDISVPISERMV